MEAGLIRRALPADIPALLSIESACFKTDKISPAQMRYLLKKARAVTFVFQQDESIAGYAMLLTPMLPRPARLYSIAVQQQYRGRKIAARLMDRILQYARDHNYTRLRLEVRKSQSHVQHLYQKCGFKVIGILPAYYADGEDGLRMQARLHK